LSKRRSVRKKQPNETEPNDLKAVTGMVEAIWAAAETAEVPLGDWVRKKVIAEVRKLKRQVGARCHKAPRIRAPSVCTLGGCAEFEQDVSP
jgi:hypothetical protein